MRLKLKLTCKSLDNLPINYNYNFSSAIYSLLQFGSPKFSEYLHDIGFRTNGKTYKLFTFSIKFEKFKIENNFIRLLSPNLHLFISSPRVDDFIKNFVIGTFEKQKINIEGNNYKSTFSIINAELIPDINFSTIMKFKLMSPMVLSTYKIFNNKRSQYYLRPEDSDDINRVLTSNTQNKYLLLTNRESKSELKITWDEDYLNRHKRITKKITIDENGKFPIDVIGMQAPFTIEGDEELIKAGYECGFGEKNSMGFGMVEPINN